MLAKMDKAFGVTVDFLMGESEKRLFRQKNREQNIRYPKNHAAEVGRFGGQNFGLGC